MEEYFTFQWRREVAFQMGGFIQVGGGGCPMGGIGFDGGVSEKNWWMAGAPPYAPPPTMGNPETLY